MLVNSGDITADELVQIANGASVDIVLTVKEANVSDEVKTAMAQAAKGYTIGQYLDISLFKYMTVKGSQQAGVALRTTKDALTISVVVLDALINTNSAVNRTYCIVRNHEGTITVLDAAFDAASKTLTFKTDRFSDYAIAYKDTAVPSSSKPSSNNSSNDSETKKNEVAAPTPASASTSKPSTITAMPQTGDTSNPTLYVVLLVASLLGLAVVFVCKKRNDK
ncbi:MAG: LPXTG cell wall anchor domain-containing protein [Gemmiger formicilis]|uniref:LPXTG cell wall anchor domain-containing protein n=1 Tax=Gemmiger formicilis TaxID=745368 RepID=UPI00399208A0